MKDNLVKVFLVVDSSFWDRLLQLVRLFPVWVIQSSTNNEVAKKCWNEALNLTTFDAHPDETPEKNCERIIASLDDHFNEFSQALSYNALEVVGAELKSVQRGAFIELGFIEFVTSPLGFIAKK